MNVETLTLEAIEARQEHLSRGLVSVSAKDMDTLGATSGDFVSVGNNKKMIFRVVRVDDSVEGKIGIDGDVRHVLGISLGENVSISKSDEKPKPLKSIEISVLENDNVPVEEIKQSIIPSLKDKRNEHLFRNAFGGSPVSVGQKTSFPLSNGEKVVCMISKILPKSLDSGIITDTTKINISDSPGQGSGVNIHYEDIGGLDEEIAKIREMVEFPMKHPKIFERLGVSAPKGVLLTGPPGTGKTLLAKAVATETDAKFISIAGPEIMSKYHGGSEENLRAKFEEAQKNTPAIIFIDEIDAIAPKRGETNDQAEKRVVTQLLTLMDGLRSRGQVVVMAATNRPDDLDEALRRPGRFDRELKINPPTEEGRRKIFEIHTRKMPIEDREAILSEFSNKTTGYTGADLEVLCKEAALHSVKPFYSELMSISEEMENKGLEEGDLAPQGVPPASGDVPASGKEGKENSTDAEQILGRREKLLSELIIKRADFVYAMTMVDPSAMREVLIKKPNVRWTDIGGLEKEKEKLKELIELPLLRPDLFISAGVKPGKGILLYGPSGTGKTLLAKAVATESNANFISVKGPELISKWVGESEKHVREIFKKARQVAPAIIFFDEFDSISKSRGSGAGGDSSEKVVNQLLTELDGIEDLEGVVVVAATNRKDLIDPSVLRPGRIDSLVELGMPDEKTREKILEVHSKDMSFEKGISLKGYVAKTDNWSGAEIEALLRNAGMVAIKRAYVAKKDKVIIGAEDLKSSFENLSKERGKNEVPSNAAEMPDMNELISKMTNPKDEKKAPNIENKKVSKIPKKKQ
ncbi:AAA family ATPase [archaeon]|jgi:transitional endoplasmic reticulum ATPase|nr:AAA family ATPase [archaeon]